MAGCGGDREQAAPPLPDRVAADLAERSDAVAAQLDAGDACGALASAQALQQRTIAAINDGRVPPRYQERLSAAVGELAASIACAPATPAAPTGSTAGGEDDDDEHDDGHGKKKGKKHEKHDRHDGHGGKGKGKGGGKG